MIIQKSEFGKNRHLKCKKGLIYIFFVSHQISFIFIELKKLIFISTIKYVAN